MIAAFMSAALPGTGHFYLGRRALGLAELAIGLGLFIWALASLTRVFLKVIDEGAPPTGILRACIPWVLLLAGYSMADAVFTWLVSRRHVVLSSPRESGR